MTEMEEYQRHIKAMNAHLEMTGFNLDLAISSLKDVTTKLDTTIEGLGKAGLELKSALEDISRAKKEIHE